MRVLIAGAGWAGLACAVELTRAGHRVTVLEASRHVGGRARNLLAIQDSDRSPNGQLDHGQLDNGQHILIGAYSETLRLMRSIGIDPQAVLLRMPLAMRFADGSGLQLPDWKNPLVKGIDVAWGIATAKGWTWRDKASLLSAALRWRLNQFECDESVSVRDVCAGISERVMQMLIEPLCVSALNTPCERASGQVFLRVLRDSLFAPSQEGANASNLLLPRMPLGDIWPEKAWDWLQKNGANLHFGARLTHIETLSNQKLLPQFLRANLDDLALRNSSFVPSEPYDAVVIATPSSEAARIAQASGFSQWAAGARDLPQEAIATVYAQTPERTSLAQPMLALKSSIEHPAQFVFDRGLLTGNAQDQGVLAFVISASQGSAAQLQAQVLAQAEHQLGLKLQPIKTIIEKRATFACTPNLKRPAMPIASNLLVCGDYIEGPYPSTLEGAVRSGIQAAKMLGDRK